MCVSLECMYQSGNATNNHNHEPTADCSGDLRLFVEGALLFWGGGGGGGEDDIREAF